MERKMPGTIDNLPQSIIDPLDQMEQGKAKVKVMTADIQRRVSENQAMLSMIKDPKALDKRDSKKYADLQKSKETLDGFLAKKGQLYAQKKELKDKIPQLVKELETQKENFKIYKQKDKVTAAEKALKTAQADYTKVRKDLASLEPKIKEKQMVFSNDLLTLRKAIATKAPTEKTLQEPSHLLMTEYLSHAKETQEARKEIGILQGYGVLDAKYADIAHRSLDLFSPRQAYYADVRDHLKQIHQITSNPYGSVMGQDQIQKVLDSLENINQKEEAYLAKDLLAQRVSAQIKKHHVEILFTEDDRLHRDKRLAFDTKNISLFEDIIAHTKEAYLEKRFRRIFIAYKETHQAASPHYYEKIQKILTMTLSTDEYARNYEISAMCQKLEDAMGIYINTSESNPIYKRVWGYQENVERSFSPDDYLLKPKVAKERVALQLQLLKKENPEWAKNILFIENNVLQLLNPDQKKKLKELLQYYPFDNLPYSFPNVSKTQIHQKMADILIEWAHNPIADADMRLTQLNSLLVDSTHYYGAWAIPPLTIPLFQEDLDAYTFSESV